MGCCLEHRVITGHSGEYPAAQSQEAQWRGGRVSKKTSGETPICMQENLVRSGGTEKKPSPF